MENPLEHLALGQATAYPTAFDPGLLAPVPRQLNRQPLGIDGQNLPFHGIDYWNAYELSWLNEAGLPQVAIAEIAVAVDSINLIESKSFKLYLNSFNESRWSSWSAVAKQLQTDLSNCAEGQVEVKLHSLQQAPQQHIQQFSGICLDEQQLSINEYDYNPELLALQDNPQTVTETLYSDLLKSNCLITNQPDWGSVLIRYQGPAIDHAALLRYLISFRRHNEFHEQCVERIFSDIKTRLKPEKLSVYARYTRRGGLDINPFRSDFEEPPSEQERLVRQ
ncbi:NADPH-dependent 7-cyano-7-deazaguanine reductase QueF [Pseudidiomarina taiwanensis]|uniref:NADPH-dependent 7-cyano-7-deazaguanine reductase n=1 Tax=Pseudidiomarina taiwanensis TaxID=337250 RepID=A0A432ZNR9_9GAMM|nr:NADPH-dependent 7-cyano-7-deazaguanine reductase QueF [Pseudidiomarina taiwanensis]RUO79502.1 NADPH-dependent 7-cyano-7-deazaguanine reductase QueF [Pseudidiomarina taiwanensis]